jgi:hypothetical protein
MKCAIFALLALPLLAQAQPPRPLPAQIREYLQLTVAQAAALAVNNDVYSRALPEKITRMRQVQAELVSETEQETLSESAIGVRYAEIELICRDLRELANTLRKQNLELLTAAQKEKLKLLEDAFALLPLMGPAQNSNLLLPWSTPPGTLNQAFGFNINALGVLTIPGCSGQGVLSTGTIVIPTGA